MGIKVYRQHGVQIEGLEMLHGYEFFEAMNAYWAYNHKRKWLLFLWDKKKMLIIWIFVEEFC